LILFAQGMDQFTAAEIGDLQQLQHLLTPDNVNAMDVYDRTVLHIAAQFGRVDCVKWCVKCAANLNARDIHQWTPLHAASSNGHIDVVHVLLDACADVDARNNCRSTSLHQAIDDNHVDVARVLIDRGASVSNLQLDRDVPAIPWVTTFVASRSKCRRVAIAVIGINKYHRTKVTVNNDHNVMRLIGKHIWSSRMDDAWMKTNDNGSKPPSKCNLQ
jgi:hypothetical protein